MQLILKSPEIKDYWCSEIDDLDTWTPEDPEHVDLWFTIEIGIEGESGGNDFYVHLVTEREISQIEDKRYLLVIPFFISWEDVVSRLRKSIADCKDINWTGMSVQLEKLYSWEYHDYKP